jgi:uncharacterized membrane protein
MTPMTPMTPSFPARPGRIIAFDLARGAAVFFMICVHVVNQLTSAEIEQHTVFGQVINLFGSTPAAPVFMTLMGVSFVLAPPPTLAAGLRRGLRLLATGYGLNVARFVAPLLVARWLDPVGAATLPHAEAGLLAYALIIDILQFAGLSYMVLSVVRAWAVPPIGVAGLLIGVTLTAPLLWGTGATVPVLGRITDLLWGARGELVAFPLFPWLAFPLSGYLMGELLRRQPSIDQFFRTLARICLPVFIIGGAWAVTNPAFHFADYWHTGPGGIVVSVGFVGLWLWGWHQLTRWLSTTLLASVLVFGSRYVTTLYLIQWTLIGWATLVVGYKTAGLTLSIVLIIGALTTTFGLTWALGGRSRRTR